jgi:NhaP-type Na+/H+ or K+/H+ antiporter
MPESTNLFARAKQYTPRDPDVATCWGIVVNAIEVRWLDSDELRELISHLQDHRDFGVEALLFAHVGDRLRVSFLDDQASCSPSAMIAALTAVSVPSTDDA